MLYFIMLFLISLMFFVFSMIVMYLEVVIQVEWNLLKMNSFNMDFSLVLDWMSLSFISLVSFISSMIYVYTMSYLKDDQYLSRFNMLLMMFIMSMYFMILSPSLISMLLGWDGLGLVSYCLVIYYQSLKSFVSGMITVLMNRVGDVFLLILIFLMMMNGSWNAYMYETEWIWAILFLASITKSAQIPFSTWLPMAMAAPTPVSALVHSSTLVTAGVYMLIRHKLFMGDSNSMLLFLSSMTMFMAGLMANFEFDLKKIIALSTLSQLGLMMSIISIGYYKLAYFHLFIHALFKSLLFMCAGAIIHMSYNNQDIRYMGGLIKIYPFMSMSMMISTLSLCGFPFLSGFFSKDLIMEELLMNNMNMFSLMLLFIATMFTVSYSVRLVLFLMVYELKMSMVIKYEENLMIKSMILLLLLSIIMGKVMSMMLFYDEVIILNVNEKMLVINCCFIGLMLGVYFKMFIKKSFINLYSFIISMWFMDYIYNEIYNMPLIFSEKSYLYFDKGCIDSLSVYSTWSSSGWMKNFFKFMYFEESSVFSIMMFIMFFIIMYLILV